MSENALGRFRAAAMYVLIKLLNQFTALGGIGTCMILMK